MDGLIELHSLLNNWKAAIIICNYLAIPGFIFQQLVQGLQKLFICSKRCSQPQIAFILTDLNWSFVAKPRTLTMRSWRLNGFLTRRAWAGGGSSRHRIDDFRNGMLELVWEVVGLRGGSWNKNSWLLVAPSNASCNRRLWNINAAPSSPDGFSSDSQWKVVGF